MKKKTIFSLLLCCMLLLPIGVDAKSHGGHSSHRSSHSSHKSISSSSGSKSLASKLFKSNKTNKTPIIKKKSSTIVTHRNSGYHRGYSNGVTTMNRVKRIVKVIIIIIACVSIYVIIRYIIIRRKK